MKSEIRKCDICGDQALQQVMVTAYRTHPKHIHAPVNYVSFWTRCAECHAEYSTPEQTNLNALLGKLAKGAAQESDGYLELEANF